MRRTKLIRVLLVFVSAFVLVSLASALPDINGKLNKRILISKADEYMGPALDSGVVVLNIEAEEDIEELKADKELKVPCNIALYDGSGKRLFEGRCSIKGHGSGTWRHDKKSWTFVFDNNTALPGMSIGKGFIAVSNYQDPSFVRNKLVYDMAEETGLAYTPKTRYVNIFYNGEYQGFYLLTDRIEQGEYRVALDEGNLEKTKLLKSYRLVENGDIKGFDWEGNKSDMDCGFMFVKAGDHPDEPIIGRYNIKYPKYASIEQALILNDYFNEFLEAAESENGINESTGKAYYEYIDLDSFARKHLVEIISKNRDGNKVSTWYYIHSFTENPKIYQGPVWDYDNTFGNYRGGDPRWRVPEGLDMLMPGLMEHEEFIEVLKQYYINVYRPWVMENLDSHLESYREEIRESVKLEQKRWPDNKYKDREFDDAVDYVRDFMLLRINYLDEIWLKNETYYRLNFIYKDETIYTAYLKEGTSAAEASETAEQMLKEQVPEVSFSGWYDWENNELFDVNEEVDRELVLYVK